MELFNTNFKIFYNLYAKNKKASFEKVSQDITLNSFKKALNKEGNNFLNKYAEYFDTAQKLVSLQNYKRAVNYNLPYLFKEDSMSEHYFQELNKQLSEKSVFLNEEITKIKSMLNENKKLKEEDRLNLTMYLGDLENFYFTDGKIEEISSKEFNIKLNIYANHFLAITNAYRYYKMNEFAKEHFFEEGLYLHRDGLVDEENLKNATIKRVNNETLSSKEKFAEYFYNTNPFKIANEIENLKNKQNKTNTENLIYNLYQKIKSLDFYFIKDKTSTPVIDICNELNNNLMHSSAVANHINAMHFYNTYFTYAQTLEEKEKAVANRTKPILNNYKYSNNLNNELFSHIDNMNAIYDKDAKKIILKGGIFTKDYSEDLFSFNRYWKDVLTEEIEPDRKSDELMSFIAKDKTLDYNKNKWQKQITLTEFITHTLKIGKEYQSDFNFNTENNKTPTNKSSNSSTNKEKIEEVIMQNQQDNLFKKSDSLKNLSLDEQIEKAFENAIGLDGAKEQLKNLLYLKKLQGDNFKISDMHMAFVGNPGTGKTSVARILANILHQNKILPTNKVVEESFSSLYGAYVGHSLQALKEKIKEAEGGILFLDEAHQLNTKKGDSSINHFNTELMNALITALENKRNSIIVVLAGYKEEMQEMMQKADKGLSSRISRIIEFPDFKVDELLQIYERILETKKNARNQSFKLGADTKNTLLKEIYKRKAQKENLFGNAREMRVMVQQTLEGFARLNEDENNTTISKEQLEKIFNIKEKTTKESSSEKITDLGIN